jgi:hypothetical protein
MSKTYKITYKTYFNDRLKEINFHGKQTYPLYVQVTFERKTIFFKSYYFELFSQSHYSQYIQGKKVEPMIKDIINKEEELIDYIIDKNQEAFSLEIFKENYAFYSKDLIDVTADDFGIYLFTFFLNRKMPSLAGSFGKGVVNHSRYELVEEMKTVLQSTLYNELIENSFAYGVFGAPYLLLYGFAKYANKSTVPLLTIMEWENIRTKAKFAEYVLETHKDKQANVLMALIDERVSILKKEGS